MPEENREPSKKRNRVVASAAEPRAKAIIASLRAGEPSSDEVFEAFWQLDGLPEEEVREALAAWVGPLPDLDRLDAATRLAHGLPLRALRLRTLSVAKDADVLDVGPIAEEQLRIAGKSWDGADLAPEDRLDGELEGSFAGTLERHVLADAEATGDTPLFDVMLFGDDSGVVFAAGTAKVVAFIAYGRVETRDRRTRIAIEGALSSRGEPAAARPSTPVEEEEAAPDVAAPSRAPAKAKTKAKASPKKRAKAPAKKVAKKAAAAKKTAKKAAKKTTATKGARKAPVKPAAKPKSAKATKTVKRAATTRAKGAKVAKKSKRG